MFSGSELTITEITVASAGDKAFSVGEASVVTAGTLTVKDASIALAAKDSSRVNVDKLSVDNAQIGIAAYQKKPEFSFSTTDIKSASMKHVDIPLVLEKGARVSINNHLAEDQIGKKQRLLLRVLKNDAPIN